MDSSSQKRWVACVVLSGTLLVGSMAGNMVYASSRSQGPSPEGKPALISSETVALAVQEIKADEERAINPDQELTLTVDELATIAEKRRLALQALQAGEAEEENINLSRGGVSQADSIISKAQSLIGTPYVFGGTGAKGFDCSGFTQYVFRASGIDLPRTSYAQFGVGTAVTREQLQPGDLVFFTTYDSGASHVGIYIGGGCFIHAASSGVEITGLGDSYYSKRYLGARRVF